MSKGGGGGGPDKVTQVQTSLPEYAEPYYKDMLARVGYESATPYTPYPDRRLQPFTAPEQEAFHRFREMGMSGTPEEMTNAARSASLISTGNPYIGQMIDGATTGQGMLEAGRGDYDTQNWIDPGVAPAYMSPYQQEVVNVEKREAARQADIRGAELGLEAAGRGSLGGYREAIMQAENERNLMQHMGDIQTRGSQHAYDRGMDAFDADRAARIAGLGEKRDWATTYAGLGDRAYQNALQGDRTRLEGVSMLGDFNAQQQAMEIERLRNMQAAGGMERDLYQKGLDIGYQDFLRQQAFPREQLSLYSAMLQGLPIEPGQMTSAYGTQPSSTQEMLGSGIAGVGLWNMLGNQGGGTPT
jgi:hypothetical protein